MTEKKYQISLTDNNSGLGLTFDNNDLVFTTKEGADFTLPMGFLQDFFEMLGGSLTPPNIYRTADPNRGRKVVLLPAPHVQNKIQYIKDLREVYHHFVPNGNLGLKEAKLLVDGCVFHNEEVVAYNGEPHVAAKIKDELCRRGWAVEVR